MPQKHMLAVDIPLPRTAMKAKDTLSANYVSADNDKITNLSIEMECKFQDAHV